MIETERKGGGEKTLAAFLEQQGKTYQDLQGLGLLFKNPNVSRSAYNSPHSLVEHVRQRCSLVGKDNVELSLDQEAVLADEVGSLVELCNDPIRSRQETSKEIERVVSWIKDHISSRDTSEAREKKDKTERYTKIAPSYPGTVVKGIDIGEVRSGDRFVLVDSKMRWFVLEVRDEDELVTLDGKYTLFCVDASLEKYVGSQLPSDDFYEEYGDRLKSGDTLQLKRRKERTNFSADNYGSGGYEWERFDFWNSKIKLIRKIDPDSPSEQEP